MKQFKNNFLILFVCCLITIIPNINSSKYSKSQSQVMKSQMEEFIKNTENEISNLKKEFIQEGTTIKNLKENIKKEFIKMKFIRNFTDKKEKNAYAIDNIGNSGLKAFKKPQNTPCELKEDVNMLYVHKIKEDKRVLQVMPVRAQLTKTSLTVYLDLLENSIRDGIRLEEITLIQKLYGEKNNCVELSAGRNARAVAKKLSFCGKDEKDMLAWTDAIMDMKRCNLTFQEVEQSKLIKDYQVLAFLLDQQNSLSKVRATPSASSSAINGALREMYYTNNMGQINKKTKKQEKLIDLILDELVDLSLKAQAKAESRGRLKGGKKVISINIYDQYTKNLNKNVKKVTKKAISASPQVKGFDASKDGDSYSMSKLMSGDKRTNSPNVDKDNQEKDGTVNSLLDSINVESPELLNNEVISGLSDVSKEAFSINICLNKNPPTKISAFDFREKICNIIQIETSNSNLNCFSDNQSKFCGVCCNHITSSNFSEEEMDSKKKVFDNQLASCRTSCSK
jgi:hypothetical protein